MMTRNIAFGMAVAVGLGFPLLHGCRTETPPSPAVQADAPAADARAFTVTLGVTNDVGRLGALQFDVQYVGKSGAFTNTDGKVDCSSQVSGALAAFNDKGKGVLTAAMVDLSGIPTPGAVAGCGFRASGDLGPQDFKISVTEAVDPDGAEPATKADVAVMSIQPAG